MRPVTVSTINKAVEEKVVPVRVARDGHPRRYVRDAAIAYVAAMRLIEVTLPKAAKRRVYRALAERMDTAEKCDGILEPAPYLLIDLSSDLPEWTRIVHSYALARAEHIEEDPEIMGGVPVVKDTRIPVHSLAAMADSGASVAEIRKEHPQLAKEAIEAAVLYARSHPKLGRPKRFR